MTTERLRTLIQRLKVETKTRTFGVIDEGRRECVRHGYMLALEEIEAMLPGQTRRNDAA